MWKRSVWSATAIVLLLSLAFTDLASAVQQQWLLVHEGTGKALGLAEWSGGRFTLRLSGLGPDQEYQVELLDANGMPFWQERFVTLAGGSARVIADTQGLTLPEGSILQIRVVSSGVPDAVVAKGQPRGR